MRSPRVVEVLRIVGRLILLVVVVVVTMLSKPEWREYFAEAGSILGALVVVRIIVDDVRRRFVTRGASPFERALRREFTSQRTPSQLLTAISMARTPEKSTFDLLAVTANQRLHNTYGIGLDNDRARDILGPDVYDLLHLARLSGPTWALRKRSGSWPARVWSGISGGFPRWSATDSRNTRESPRAVSIEAVQKILTCLEQL
jgi:hypothetical protein